MCGFRELFLVSTAILCSNLGCQPNEKSIDSVTTQVLDQITDEIVPILREEARHGQSYVLAKATFAATPLNSLAGVSFITTCLPFDDHIRSQMSQSGSNPSTEAESTRLKKMQDAICIIPLFSPMPDVPPAQP